jgi:aminodeoxyfutalosine synthase
MQLHLVSSIHPDKSFGWYCDIISAIHSAFPRVHIKAYTAVEIAYFAESSGKTFLEVLGELKSAGLSSLPGGGAEIFDSEVRKQIAPKKIAADTWLKVHQAAHQLGIPTNASMLFGHLETPEQIVDHLLRIRDLQDKSLCKMEEGGGVTSCFDCFVPLVYHGVNTELSRRFMIEPISPQRILRTIAVSRIILRNVNHIKAYWVTLGEQLSQIALSYGADDFDGTVIEEKIHHEAGSNTPKGLTEQHIKNLITTADKIPVNYTNTKNQ